MTYSCLDVCSMRWQFRTMNDRHTDRAARSKFIKYDVVNRSHVYVAISSEHDVVGTSWGRRITVVIWSYIYVAISSEHDVVVTSYYGRNIVVYLRRQYSIRTCFVSVRNKECRCLCDRNRQLQRFVRYERTTRYNNWSFSKYRDYRERACISQWCGILCKIRLLFNGHDE